MSYQVFQVIPMHACMWDRLLWQSNPLRSHSKAPSSMKPFSMLTIESDLFPPLKSGSTVQTTILMHLDSLLCMTTTRVSALQNLHWLPVSSFKAGTMCWLILCVNLTSHGVPRYLAKHNVWECLKRCIWMIAFELVGSVKQIVFNVWAGIIQSTESLTRTKRWKKEEFTISAWLTELVSCPQTWARTYSFGSSGSCAFRLRMQWHHQLPWLSSLQRADCGTFNPPCMSQFLVIHILCYVLFLYSILVFPTILQVLTQANFIKMHEEIM